MISKRSLKSVKLACSTYPWREYRLQIPYFNFVLSTPGRKDSEGISKSRLAINEEKVNKMKDELNYFKDKFEKNEEIKLGKLVFF